MLIGIHGKYGTSYASIEVGPYCHRQVGMRRKKWLRYTRHMVATWFLPYGEVSVASHGTEACELGLSPRIIGLRRKHSKSAHADLAARCPGLSNFTRAEFGTVRCRDDGACQLNLANHSLHVPRTIKVCTLLSPSRISGWPDQNQK